MISNAYTTMFSKSIEKEFHELIQKYPSKRSALIPALYIVQRELGYVTPEGIEYVGNLLDMTPAQITEVASFYTMLYLKPVGKNVLWVCHNLSCNLCGAEEIIQHLEKNLGIHPGETTPDGLFTLFRQECLASCDTGPVMQVNDDYEENLNPKRVDEILEKLRAEEEG
jgi:NADH-quinone oxidoreductase E subunit